MTSQQSIRTGKEQHVASSTPHRAPAHRFPASMEDILRAQDEGARSWHLGPAARCPYDPSTREGRFLREQWAMGRAVARVEAFGL